MPLARWHWGKLVILWAWGGTLAALSLTVYLAEPAEKSPGVSAVTLFLTLGILVALSVVTWRWLSGKERP